MERFFEDERNLTMLMDFYELTMSNGYFVKGLNREIRLPLDVVLVTELADEDHEDERVFPLEGDSADLEDIIRTVFVLNMDSKLLCKEDCKGLCCRCGKNLNEEACTCQKEIDPRLAALKQLLK